MLPCSIAAINGEEEEIDSDEDAELDTTPPPSPPVEHRDAKKPQCSSSSLVHNHLDKV